MRDFVHVFLCTMLVLPSAWMSIASPQALPTTQPRGSEPGIDLAPGAGLLGDPGSGWSPDVLASWLSLSDVQRNASVGADRNGNIHAAYENYEPSSGRYGLCIANSQDGGMVWNSQDCFSMDNENFSHPSIAVNFTGGESLLAFEDSSGGLRVHHEFPHMSGWIWNLTANPGDHNPSITISRNDSANAFLTFERDDGAGGVDIMFMVARDRSVWKAWEGPQILVGGFDHSINRKPRVAWGGPNDVYVVYERQNVSGDRDVFMMRSSNGGTPGSWTFEPGTPVAATADDEFAPDVATVSGSGTVVVPLVRPKGIYRQIDVAYSEDWGNDTTWKVTPVTGEPSNHENPRVAAVPAVGAVRIVYWSFWGVFESTAPVSSLSSWRAPVRVSDGAARLTTEYDTPAVAAYPYGGKWYAGVVWTDYRNGLPNYDIYYSTNSPKLFFPSPDLAPLSIGISPSPPLSNGTVAQVNVAVANLANVSAGEFDLLLFDDGDGDKMPDPGENVSTSHSDGIASFAQTKIMLTWNATPARSHSLCAYADPPPGMVVESNETNNVMCIDVLVQPGPILRPDYVPVSPLPLPPIRMGMSSPVVLSIQVLNQGNGTATDNAIVAFYEQSSSPFSTFVLSPLAPATASPRFTATWTSPAIPGICLVSVDVDHDNNVTEWDETNNVYTWTIEVVSGPLTSLLMGSPNYTSASTHLTYVRSSTHLDFSVNDQSGLGIRNTTYRIDGGDWVNYTATGQFVLAGEGRHALEWYSEDYAGNVENASFANLTVDDTPPATTISPTTTQVESGTYFTLEATDSGSGVNHTEYRVDGGTWIRYTASFNLSEGNHNITYRSVDNLGNLENEKYLNVKVHGPSVPTQPPSVEANYKPLVALVFAIILAVVGLWSSKRRPWKGGKDKMAVVKAFVIMSLPFVLAEAATGIVSFMTGELSIPPLLGLGTALDFAIFMSGLVVTLLSAGKQGKEEHHGE